MYTKKLYLSGGSFYELQKLFSRVTGVVAARVGYIDSAMPEPTHEQVLSGECGAAFGVEVEFNPKKTDISQLLDIFFTVINPYVKDRQGDLVGRMYRSGVYYLTREDEPQVSLHMNFIKNRKKELAVTEANITINDPKPEQYKYCQCYTTMGVLQNFYPAGEEHQNYLAKHPETETRIDFPQLETLGII